MGWRPGEEISVELEPGKALIIKFLTVGEPQPDGKRVVFFELNGQPREVTVQDKSLNGSKDWSVQRLTPPTRAMWAHRSLAQ